MTMTNTKPNNHHRRGFASMTPERRAEISSQGGKATPPEKRAFSRDRELAAEAGRKGGLASGPIGWRGERGTP